MIRQEKSEPLRGDMMAERYEVTDFRIECDGPGCSHTTDWLAFEPDPVEFWELGFAEVLMGHTAKHFCRRCVERLLSPIVQQMDLQQVS